MKEPSKEALAVASYIINSDEALQLINRSNINDLALKIDEIISPTIDAVNKYRRTYGQLHDGLSDMIEGGRLEECDIPDDYQWLVRQLVFCCSVEQKFIKATQ